MTSEFNFNPIITQIMDSFSILLVFEKSARIPDYVEMQHNVMVSLKSNNDVT